MNSVLSVSHLSPFCPNHTMISWRPRVALHAEDPWSLALEKILPSLTYILRLQRDQEELINLRRGDV